MAADRSRARPLLPDERVHLALSELGWRGWRRAQADYLGEPRAWEYPPPLRYAWALPLRYLTAPAAGYLGHCLAVVAALALSGPWAALLTASAPLAWVMRGRLLADTAVGAVWLAAVLSGSPAWAGVAALVCLGMKEGSLVLLPALVVACSSRWGAAAGWVAAGAVAWALVTTAVCGRQWVRVLWRSVRSQGHEYTRGYQSGGWLRVAVDAFMVSGWVWVALGWCRGGGPVVLAALTALGCQAVGPVQNVRVSVGADWAVRCVVGVELSRHGWPGMVALAVGIGVDAWTAIRLRAVTDPVTAELGRALGSR